MSWSGQPEQWSLLPAVERVQCRWGESWDGGGSEGEGYPSLPGRSHLQAAPPSLPSPLSILGALEGPPLGLSSPRLAPIHLGSLGTQY